MAFNSEQINNNIILGNIIISPFVKENLQVNSYDVTLGEYYYTEKNTESGIYNIWSENDTNSVWSLNKAATKSDWKNPGHLGNLTNLENISDEDKIIWLDPGERILGHTNEFIGGRNCVTTMMKSRSSMNRSCISTCLCAGWGDTGYTNRWTMEITNHSRYNSIPLVVGRRIAQIVFLETGKTTESYVSSGKYQNSNNIDEIIKSWKPESMLPKLYRDREIKNTV